MAFVSCNSINIYYEIHGQGHPLLLIHGLGSSTVDWEIQINEFSKHYQVIALDLRGHGRSDKPEGDYSIELFADDVACLIRELNIAPAHVVGISLGGMIALQLAVAYGELLRSIIIVNSVSEFPQNSLKDKLQIFMRLFVTRVMGLRKMGEMLGKQLFPKPEHSQLRQDIADRWAQNDKKAYLKATKSLFTWSITDQLDKISCPTLIVGADMDYFPVSNKEALRNRIKDAELVIVKDSRHATPLDQPAVFNKAVLDFLKDKGD